MTRGWTLVVASGLVLLGAGIVAAENVTLDQVPAAVRETIERETRGGRVKEIERESRRGRTLYEVEFEQGDEDYEIHVSEDGTLLSRRED